MGETRAEAIGNWRFAAGVVGVAVLAAVSIAPSLGGGILDFADSERVLRNPRSKSLSAIFSAAGEGSYTPLGELSYAVDRAFFGDSPRWLRLHGLLSAAAFAALAALVAAKAAGSRGVGLVAGALLAVHPLAVEPGAWIAARTVHCAGVFLAFSALAWLPGAEGPGRSAPARIIGATLLFIAACFTHPLALAYPPMLLVLAALPMSEGAVSFRARVRPVIALVPPALAIGVVHALTAPFGVESRDLALSGGAGAYILRTFAATGRTLVAIIAPVRLAPDYSSGLTTSAGFGVGSIALVAVLAALSWRYRRREPAVGVFLGWTLVTVLPAAALTAGFGGDRYALFAVVAACVLAARLAARAWRGGGPGGRLATGSVAASVLIAMLVASMVTSYRWRSDQALWGAVVRMRPASPRAHLRLGRLKSAIGLCAPTESEKERYFSDARAEILKARDLGAAETAWRLELGGVFFRWGYYGEASRHLSEILDRAEKMGESERIRELSPRMLSDLHFALGAINESASTPHASGAPGIPGAARGSKRPEGQQRLHLAKSHYGQSLAYSPERPDAMWGLGKVLNRLGQFDEAAEILRLSAELAPDEAKVHAELGRALESSLRYKEAEAAYLRAAELDELNRSYAESVRRVKRSLEAAERPGGPEAGRARRKALSSFREGLRLRAAGKFLDAFKALKLAAGQHRGFAAAHQMAGDCAFRLGRYEWAKEHLTAADLDQPRNLVTVYLLARTELKLARLNAAEARFSECIRIDRKFGPAHLWLASLVLYRDEPDYDDALALVAPAVRLGTPGAVELRDYLSKLKSGEIDPDAGATEKKGEQK